MQIFLAMLLAAGLLTAIGVLYNRLGPVWSGARRGTQQAPWFRKVDRFLWQASCYRLGVDAPADFEFSLVTEWPLDRYAKARGWAFEDQIGISEFDEKVYIVADDPRVAEALGRVPEAARMLAKAMESVAADQRVSEVHCRNGRLWIEVDLGKSDTVAEIEGDPQQRLRPLRQIAESLARVGTAQSRPHKAGAAKRHAVVDALVWAMLVSGSVATLWFSLDLLPGMANATTIWVRAAWIAPLLTALGVVGAGSWLGRSARRFAAAKFVVFAGGPAAFFWASGGASVVNIALDDGLGQQVEMRLVDAWTRSVKSRGYPVIRLAGAAPDTATPIGIDVEHLPITPVGTRYTVRVHAGALGWPWVDAVAPTD